MSGRCLIWSRFLRIGKRELTMALSNKDMSIVMGMLARGDHQHDIAAWFCENGGRIAEIARGDHGAIAAAPKAELPPRGAVGRKGRRLRAYVNDALSALRNGGD